MLRGMLRGQNKLILFVNLYQHYDTTTRHHGINYYLRIALGYLQPGFKKKGEKI
jgi:hypothetical protein